MKIPCENCLCLPACKHKTFITCDILYTFMDSNVEYDPKGDTLKAGAWIWEEIDIIFSKDWEIILNKGPFHNINYII